MVMFLSHDFYFKKAQRDLAFMAYYKLNADNECFHPIKIQIIDYRDKTLPDQPTCQKLK